MENDIKTSSNFLDTIIATFGDYSMWVTFAIMLGVFFAIVLLANSFMPKQDFKKRLAMVDKQSKKLKQANRAMAGLRKSEEEGFMKRIVDKYNLRNAFSASDLEIRLLRAGIYDPGAATKYFFFKLAGPFIGIFVAIFVVKILLQMETPILFVIVAGFGLGFYAPGIYISNVAKKRQQQIMEAFPDSLDLLLICVETGMSVEAAFKKVSEEFSSASPPLAQEMAMTIAELNYLEERRKAFENLAKRVPHPGVKAVSTALTQAERYGTPVGQALRVMAAENRQMRVAAAEQKGAALPAKLTVPMIVFFVPVLFVVILTPAYVQWRMQNDGANPN